jgi:hypothetical protein
MRREMKRILQAGLYYALDTVPRVYDMEGRKSTNKELKNKKM